MNKKSFSGSVTVCGELVKFAGATEWEDYDERFSHNGGSYYQPTHVISWSAPDGSYTLTIEDTSCGDFGVRVYAQLDKDDCCIAQASYGSMTSQEQEFTDFDNSFACCVAIAIAESLGYRIPTHEE